MCAFEKNPALGKEASGIECSSANNSSDISSYVQNFTQYMNENGICFTDAGDDIFQVTYEATNLPSISVYIVFQETDIYFWSATITKVDLSKTACANLICNQLNQDYKWARFFVTDAGEIHADINALYFEHNLGEQCHKIIEIMLAVIDQAYPKIMHAIWS